MDTSSLTNVAPKRLPRIPVEIWREIIDQLLSDPVRFKVDPFYPGCNLHTALDQWFDKRPLRTLEVQRGTLCLVSHSWKALAESSRWTYFEAKLPIQTQKPDPRIYSAGRLMLDDRCSACGRSWSGKMFRCSCSSFTDNMALEAILPPDVDSHPPKAQILTFRFWDNDHHTAASTSQERTLRYFQPSIRALDIRTSLSLGVNAWRLLSNLTFLCVKMQVIKDRCPLIHSPSMKFSVMKTFRLVVGENIDCAFLEHWQMPVLAHFEVISALMEEENLSIFIFIEKCGRNMISLRLRFEFCSVLLPENIWHSVPLLEYLAVTTLYHDTDSDPPTFPSLPGGHPLHTFAILDEKEIRGLVRLDSIALFGQWRGITTIADSHIWDTSVEIFGDECQSAVKMDSPISHYYCSCIGTLYAVCMHHGIRYEDRMGKSYAEFLKESSL